ncbi:unnamed protein product, partial [Coccothraustes coccothraustes]
FAARLLSGVLDYREQLQRRDPPEPWVQAAFGGCRVPGSRRDEVLRVPPGAQPPPFVTVSANGQPSPAPPDRLSRASLGRIQRSLLLLSLDSPVLAPPGGRGPEGVAAQVLHGGGANANSANRWWDKTLQARGQVPIPRPSLSLDPK